MKADEELIEITRKMLSDFEEFTRLYICCIVASELVKEILNEIDENRG